MIFALILTNLLGIFWFFFVKQTDKFTYRSLKQRSNARHLNLNQSNTLYIEFDKCGIKRGEEDVISLIQFISKEFVCCTESLYRVNRVVNLIDIVKL